MSLDWKQFPGPYLLKARHYVIGQYGDERFVGWYIVTVNQPRKVGEYRTLEEARQACDEHHKTHMEAA